MGSINPQEQGSGQCYKMLDDIEAFFVSIAPALALILAWCYMLLALALIKPVPLNYIGATLPVAIAYYLWRREMIRKERLGFAHDRIREIPLLRQEEALKEYIERVEKERKKTKPLP